MQFDLKWQLNWIQTMDGTVDNDSGGYLPRIHEDLGYERRPCLLNPQAFSYLLPQKISCCALQSTNLNLRLVNATKFILAQTLESISNTMRTWSTCYFATNSICRVRKKTGKSVCLINYLLPTKKMQVVTSADVK